jgi:DNA polymerase I-like protein with 3'-5' exonuclease and polymerase domains
MPLLFHDIEFVGDDPRKPVEWDPDTPARLLCVGYRREEHPLVVTRPGDNQTWRDFVQMLADPAYIKVAHNTTESVYLQRMGLEVNGEYHDTMTMAWLRNENTELSLEECAMRYAGRVLDKRIKQRDKRPYFRTSAKGHTPETWVPLEDVPFELLAKYNGEDVEATVDLYGHLRTALASIDMDDHKGATTLWEHFVQRQVPFTELLINMELAGLPMTSQKNINRAKAQIEGKREFQSYELERILGYEIGGWSKRKDLESVLFTKWWHQKETIPHGLNLTQPVLRDYLAKELDIPKSKVDPRDIEILKQEWVRAQTPKGFTVQTVTSKNLKGYWMRQGRGLEACRKRNPKGEWVVTTSTPDLMSKHYQDEFVLELIKWRKLEKLLNTYLEVYEKRSYKGRLYGRYRLNGTVTGRISSSGPNLMNQPSRGELGKLVRGLFKGRLIVGDMSQLEPRILAHYSHDPALMKAYTTGDDVYMITAEGIFGKRPDGKGHARDIAKTSFLGTRYGAGWAKLLQILALNDYPLERLTTLLGIPGRSPEYTGKLLLNRLDQTFYGAKEWEEEVKTMAAKYGYVDMIDGRRRHLPDIGAPNWKDRGYAERQAVNAKMQGSAAAIMRESMLEVTHVLPFFKTLTQVHDEVVWEADPDMTTTEVKEWLPMLKDYMENAHGYELNVPLVFDPVIAATWADKDNDGGDVEWLDE